MPEWVSVEDKMPEVNKAVLLIMRYKGVEITPVKRPNEPYCNSCGDSGERWKVRICLDEVGGSTVILCTDCLRALATMSFDVQNERNAVKTARCVATDDGVICSECGMPFVMTGARFCPMCGARLLDLIVTSEAPDGTETVKIITEEQLRKSAGAFQRGAKVILIPHIETREKS